MAMAWHGHERRGWYFFFLLVFFVLNVPGVCMYQSGCILQILDFTKTLVFIGINWWQVNRTKGAFSNVVGQSSETAEK